MARLGNSIFQIILKRGSDACSDIALACKNVSIQCCFNCLNNIGGGATFGLHGRISRCAVDSVTQQQLLDFRNDVTIKKLVLLRNVQLQVDTLDKLGDI
jgi:hypothetical protein